MGFYDDLEVSNPEGENLESDANYQGPASEVHQQHGVQMCYSLGLC